MKARGDLSEEEKVKIVVLWDEGISQVEIARRLKVHKGTISKCLKRYREREGV